MGKIGLIIGREFNQRVRKKSFIITTLLMPLALVAMIVVPVLIQMYGGGGEHKEIVVVDESQVMGGVLLSDGELSFEYTETQYPEVVTQYPTAFGYLVIGKDVVENPRNVQLYTQQSSTVSLESSIKSQLSEAITQIRIENTGIEQLDSLMKSVNAKVQLQTFGVQHSKESGEVEVSESSSAVAMGLAYVGSMMIYMFILLYGVQILQGVVEEKSNRIIEVMVSSVRPFELMMGKILGVAFVALLQFLIWVVIVGAAVVALPMFLGGGAAEVSGVMAAGGGEAAAMGALQESGILSALSDMGMIMRMLGAFIVLFVGGYLLYASMFAAIGSAADSIQDTQQLQFPVTLPLIIAIFVMISAMQTPDSGLAYWCSLIPFTSPIIMMARVAYGVPMWEFLLSVVLLYGTFVGITYLAAKIYRVGIFMYGKKPSFMELLRWMRYKG